MFEQFHLTRLHFSGSDLSSVMQTNQMPAEGEADLMPMLQADFILDGYVDVLDFIPQPEDAWYARMRLQSFSQMKATENYYTERKDLDSYLILYTVSGSGILRYEGRTYTLHAGDLFWIDCRKHHHYYTAGREWNHCDIHVGGSDAALLYETFRKSGRVVLQEEELSVLTSYTSTILKAYVESSPIRSLEIAHAIEGLSFYLIRKAWEPEQKAADSESGRQIKKALRFMHEHFREPVRLDEIALQANMSKYHFSRCFRNLTGFPPNEYLIRLRLDHAKTLLENTSLSIRTIGEISGFQDEAYFSRLFRRRTGVSALKYRQEKRKSLLF